MDIAPSLLIGVLGAAVGAYISWRVIGSYYTNEPSAREKELWKRIAELQALLKVPPMFWHVWARYTDELSQKNNECQTPRQHPADSETNEPDAPRDRPHPGDDRDQRP